MLTCSTGGGGELMSGVTPWGGNTTIWGGGGTKEREGQQCGKLIVLTHSNGGGWLLTQGSRGCLGGEGGSYPRGPGGAVRGSLLT